MERSRTGRRKPHALGEIDFFYVVFGGGGGGAQRVSCAADQEEPVDVARREDTIDATLRLTPSPWPRTWRRWEKLAEDDDNPGQPPVALARRAVQQRQPGGREVGSYVLLPAPVRGRSLPRTAAVSGDARGLFRLAGARRRLRRGRP